MLLSYPNLNEPFEIHMDTSDLQLDAIISQNGKPIVFYRKNQTQHKRVTQQQKKNF